MPKLPLKLLTKFLATLMNNIFAAILISAIGIPVLLSWATGTLSTLIQTIKLATPLWATISLALLLLVYIHLKTQSLSNPPAKTVFRGNVLWVKDDPNPYCPRCYDSEQKLVHMTESKITKFINNSPQWVPSFKCIYCVYETEQSLANKALQRTEAAEL